MQSQKYQSARTGTRHTTLESWLGKQQTRTPDVERAVRRYLAAFGPAAAADLRAWSGLTGAREILERMRPRLRTFSDESGRELFDVPDGALADEDTPAPPRFLPEYDNVLLSHADRSRVVAEDLRHSFIYRSGPHVGTVLVDGYAQAAWHLMRSDDRVTLRLLSHASLAKGARAAVSDEAARLLEFMEPDAASRDIEIVQRRAGAAASS